MKKIFLLLSLVLFAACNKGDDAPQPDPHYSGRLTVTSNTTPTATPYLADGIRYELVADANGIYSLRMNNMKFTATMPMSLNIVIPALAASEPTDGGPTVFTSALDPIVPHIGGKPYPQYQIPEFSCSLAPSGKLEVTFTCINPKTPVGNETLNHKAVYSGEFRN